MVGLVYNSSRKSHPLGLLLPEPELAGDGFLPTLQDVLGFFVVGLCLLPQFLGYLFLFVISSQSTADLSLPHPPTCFVFTHLLLTSTVP